MTASLLVASPVPAVAPGSEPVHAADARAILSTLIGIDSTHAHGSTRAAEAIAAALSAGGFAQSDLELIRPAPDKGNLLVHLHGRSPGPPVLFLGHLDVVEAKPEDWTVPPFELTERDGYFYGRGTQDMKGDVAASVASLIRLHREGFVPEQDFYFAYTSDEEAGGTLNGVEWLMSHRPELRQATYAINFDAGGGDSEQGRPLLMRLQTSEKVYASFRFETTGPGGHSSLPTPDNPIYRLAHALLRVEAYPFPLHLTATARGYFAGLASTESGERRADLQAVGKSGDAEAAARLAKEPEFNAMLRTTCVATEISGGHAENALPQRARATVQCRLIPGESPAAIQDQLTELAADPGVAITPIEAPVTSSESVIMPAVSQALRSVTNVLWPGTPVVPSMDAGADDSVYTRNAGIPTYGISGLFTDFDDVRAHGQDERMRSRDFYADVEFHYRLYRALSRRR